MTKVSIHFGRVRMNAMRYSIYLIIFILHSVQSYTVKIIQFRWVQIAPLNNDNKADVIEAFRWFRKTSLLLGLLGSAIMLQTSTLEITV